MILSVDDWLIPVPRLRTRHRLRFSFPSTYAESARFGNENVDEILMRSSQWRSYCSAFPCKKEMGKDRYEVVAAAQNENHLASNVEAAMSDDRQRVDSRRITDRTNP